MGLTYNSLLWIVFQTHQNSFFILFYENPNLF
jgi:hypothetical protein